jgi:UDP-glucose 4-epimerase
MKALITGGFGYLGGRLAQFLAIQAGYQILLGTRQHAEPPPWLPQAELAQTQWDSPTGLAQNCSGVDAVVHLAGMNAQDCVADPVAALEFNAVGTARLLQAAVRQGVRRFIYVSTAHVYGSPLTGVITEETCPVSLHPYATSHRAAEDIVRAANQRGEIEGIVIRLSNSYGAPADKDANCWMLLVNDLCYQAVTTQRMVLDTSGTQRRNFITLTDACMAIRHLLDLSHHNLGDGLFNVGGGWNPTILEMTEHVAARIHAVTGQMPEILRKTAKELESPMFLEYRIKKLIGTGFNTTGSDNVDQEIDGLIQFCLRHFTQHS